MSKFTLHFLIVSLVTGIYGFGGFGLWGTEAARVLFLIAADLFVVSLFARLIFKNNPDVISRRIKS
ncbi:MAG: DUF1328 domain-containing protein [Leeuwenhoekiella sp.]